jgi:ABC-type dipeptide/oligopeptide/nickel transport system permease subunit
LLSRALVHQNRAPMKQQLPRPPGTAFLVAVLGDGRGGSFHLLRIAWTVLGAATVGFLAAVSARAWGPVAGLASGLWAGTSVALLMLASSVDAEMPYLALVAASMTLVDRRPTPLSLASWAALQGLACLFRVAARISCLRPT